MTREKAIRTLELIKHTIVWKDYPPYYQLALDMAIDAIKHQHCEDCISREFLKTVVPQPEINILDKIRDEIEQTAKDYDKFDDYRRKRGLWIALDIIDKYKEESEK